MLEERFAELEKRVHALESNIVSHVETALSGAVTAIESSADRVAGSTRVRAVVSLAGAFFGSASVAIVVEIMKRL